MQVTFGFSDGSRNFFEKLFQTFFRLLWSFCCTKIRLNPSSGDILYHERVSFSLLIEDFLISRHQVTKLFFLLEVLLRQCVFCKELVVFVRKTYFAISVILEAGKYCAVLPWFWNHFRRTFRILCPEKRVRAQAFPCPLDYLWNPPSNHSGRSRKRSSESRLPFFFLIVFCVIGLTLPHCLVHVRHFDPILDLLMMSPAMSMLKTNSNQYWKTTPEQQEIRNCSFYNFCLFFLVNRYSWLLTHSCESPCSSQRFQNNGTVGVSSNICTVTVLPGLFALHSLPQPPR